MVIILLLYVILFSVMAWRNLTWAAALVIVFLPVYQIRFEIFNIIPSTLLEAMILILFIVWFIQSVQSQKIPLFTKKRIKRARRYPFYREIIAVLIIALIATAVAGANNSALGLLKAYFMEPVMFFIVLVNIFLDKNNRITIFRALALSAFIVSVAAIYQKITGDLIPVRYAGSGRVTGVFAYPNAVGLYLGPVAVFLSGWLVVKVKERGLKSLLNILCSGFVLLTIILSFLAIYFARSEGAMIGVMAAYFVFFLFYNKLSRQLAMAAVIFGVLLLGVKADLRHDVYQKITFKNLDGQIRTQIWKETKNMLGDGNFIFGAGLANYQNKVGPYHQAGIFVRDYDDPDFQKKVLFDEEYHKNAWQPTEIYLYPHNIILNFWSELGFFGMFIFLWLIIRYFTVSYAALKKSNAAERGLILGLGTAMIVIVVHGLVDVPYFKNDLAVVFWLFFAMLGALYLEKFPQVNKVE
ncbi:MAG: O-antigen ligase family protein [bacterium]|nr:O-antigen ligase family protein [bacterium]